MGKMRKHPILGIKLYNMMIFLGLSAAVIITAAICDIPVFYAVQTALYLWHL
jgi:hypothetical protein